MKYDRYLDCMNLVCHRRRQVSSIFEKDGKMILEVTKAFGVELDSMKFDKS